MHGVVHDDSLTTHTQLAHGYSVKVSQCLYSSYLVEQIATMSPRVITYTWTFYVTCSTSPRDDAASPSISIGTFI